MRRIITTTLILAMSIVFANIPAPAQAAQTSKTFTLLAYGDSLTAGYGLPAGQSFPDRLGELLRAKGYDVRIVNAGVSGDTTAGGLARLDWTLAERPDAAILCLGANDALRGLPVDRMQANLDAMLARFAKDDIPVLLAGMRAPLNYGPNYGASYADVFPRLAAKHDVLFYPFLLDGIATDPSLNQPDGIHPNAAGARKIAEKILPMAEKLLEKAGAKPKK